LPKFFQIINLPLENGLRAVVENRSNGCRTFVWSLFIAAV